MTTKFRSIRHLVAVLAVAVGTLSSAGAASDGKPDSDLQNTILAVDVDNSGVLPARHLTLVATGFTADIGLQPKWGVGGGGHTFSIAWDNTVDTRITATLKSGSYEKGGGEGHYVALYPDQLVQRVTVTFSNGRALDQPLDATGGSPIDIPAGAKWVQKIDIAYDGGNANVIHFVWNFKPAPPPKQKNIAIQIAPMLSAGADGASNGNLPPDSAFTDIDGGAEPPAAGFRNFDDVFNFVNANLGKIQKGMFKRIGITPCSTEPVELKDKEGAQDFIEVSEVLNDGGQRTSFGYFIRFKIISNLGFPQQNTFFALFSYDKIKFKQLVRLPICATEFFLFDYAGADSAQDLKLGVAIGSQGQRLDEVPIELARVWNFRSTHPEDETVKPGVTPDKGCMVCHGMVGKTPQQTLPFPWLAASAGAQR